MSEPSAQLWLLGCSHHATSLAERERLALAPRSWTPEAAAALRQQLGAAELFTLATCNRLEFYVVGPAPPNARAAIAQLAPALPPEVNREVFGRYAFFEQGESAATHLFAVAAGLDSQMVGETEITGQVKTAYRQADRAGTVGRCLHRLLQKGLQAAKWARNETGIGRGQVSIGNIAAELAARVCGELPETSILLLGTGEVGAAITQALHSRGAKRLLISGRNVVRARALADQFAGAAVLPFSHREASLEYVDVVISCTGAPEAILSCQALRRARRGRTERPLFMIDLAVPRDIEPSIADFETFYLYNMDDLARIANRNLSGRQEEMAKARAGLHERAARAWAAANPAKALPELPTGPAPKAVPS